MEPTLWNHILGLFWFSLFMLPVAFLLYMITHRVVGEPHVPARVFPYVALTIISWCANRLITLYANGWNILSAALWYLIILHFVFDQRGWMMLLNLLKLMVLLVVLELICALIVAILTALEVNPDLLLVITLEDMFEVRKLMSTGMVNLIGALPILLAILLWEQWNARRKKLPDAVCKRQWLYTTALLRLALLVIAALSVFAMPHFLLGTESFRLFLMPKSKQYILLIASVGLLLAVALSYIVQDIRYILQLQRLNTLEQQQAISRSLVANLRYFRHNMVNMLYGLEGVLISGDRERVTAYYNEMREKCALVNNENIAALERITNPSVSAVLLRAVDRAREMSLPVNLYVQEGVVFPHILSDTDLCQVLGVLTDNAIEAAHQAAERHVSVELRNVDDALEIIVRNTYAGEISPECLNLGGASTKEGHEGQGLKSCYHILGRKKGAFLNFWVTGQYVQAQLLLGR